MADEQQKQEQSEQTAKERLEAILATIRREMRENETIGETLHRERTHYENEHRGEDKRT